MWVGVAAVAETRPGRGGVSAYRHLLTPPPCALVSDVFIEYSWGIAAIWFTNIHTNEIVPNAYNAEDEGEVEVKKVERGPHQAWRLEIAMLIIENLCCL